MRQLILSKKHVIIVALVFMLSLLQISQAQTRLLENSKWVKTYSKLYDAHIDIVYHSTDTVQVKLDLYTPKNPKGNTPVLIFFHGGGWSKGTKDSMTSQLTHYMASNFAVVNVEYRLFNRGLAPAAVIDCRCALAWVYENAATYHFDTTKIVTSGGSAGGHLAMITGMLPAKSEFDKECNHSGDLKVAAIVNFYGISDVKDILAGDNRKGYAVRWLGDQKDKEAIADKVSPIQYLRKDLPPIFTVHGDADPTVPYTQAVKLHKALTELGVVNEFMTIPGGLHGKFSKEEMIEIYKKSDEFLRKNANINMKDEN